MSRVHRTAHERWKIQHPGSHHKGKTAQSAEATDAHADATAGIMHYYQQVMKTLARSDRGEDRQLAVDLVHYLDGRGWAFVTERERGKDHER